MAEMAGTGRIRPDPEIPPNGSGRMPDPKLKSTGASPGALDLVTRVRDPLTVSSQGVEDLIGRLVPDEWLRFVVPVVHPCGDGRLELFD